MVESPYAGDVAANLGYLELCIAHSLELGEAPFASHGFYTQFLDDTRPDERATGLLCRDSWAARADAVRFYVDRGVSSGMWQAYLEALSAPTEPLIEVQWLTDPGGLSSTLESRCAHHVAYFTRLLLSAND
jgi:hypothetical protein